MKTNVLAMIIASGFMACSSAYAMTSDQHKEAKEKIEADYKAQKSQCETLKDNAKDVCEEEAEAKENVAKATLEQQYKPSSDNARKVEEAKAEGAHDVAKEKCDDQSGDAKDTCQKQAKADYDKAKADIKAKNF